MRKVERGQPTKMREGVASRSLKPFVGQDDTRACTEGHHCLGVGPGDSTPIWEWRQAVKTDRRRRGRRLAPASPITPVRDENLPRPIRGVSPTPSLVANVHFRDENRVHFGPFGPLVFCTMTSTAVAEPSAATSAFTWTRTPGNRSAAVRFVPPLRITVSAVKARVTSLP